MKNVILVVNAGSSSLKVAIFAVGNNKVGELLFNVTLQARDIYYLRSSLVVICMK